MIRSDGSHFQTILRNITWLHVDLISIFLEINNVPDREYACNLDPIMKIKASQSRRDQIWWGSCDERLLRFRIWFLLYHNLNKIDWYKSFILKPRKTVRQTSGKYLRSWNIHYKKIIALQRFVKDFIKQAF